MRLRYLLAIVFVLANPGVAFGQAGADEFGDEDFGDSELGDEHAERGLGDEEHGNDRDEGATPVGTASPIGAPEVIGAPGPGSLAVDGEERMRLLVVDAATFGIDPVVGRVATAELRETAAEIGYEVMTREQTVAAAQQLRMPYPPTPADLWRVSWVARVHRGVFARIWAHAGHYVVEITVASLDGAGPFFARGTAGAADLRESVERLFRSALPTPEQWNAEGAERAGTTPPSGATGSPTGAAEAIADPDEFDEDEDEPGEREPEEPAPELRRWQLALQTEGAIGAAEEVYYNHLAGLRLDFRITRDILLGVYFAYANLNARNGRADNIFFMLQFENRIRISSDLDLTIPLRAGVGYLPFNGPVIRVAAGLNYALSPDWEIALDLITPTFWILPDRVAVSLNVGLEVILRF